ncbi:hypothetical protein [Fictibacillus sp. BK138]|uniref:hypothetical protein n=1 Tax=Fictibacillus sp. BK138 TaxID=2512121 RepID=UPI0010298AB2|nr:hypothetical protein [Fictibacillus sp. BK138]RZT23469.1 hypothetical protein EV282_2559 [Fictibacillus sp. BK138]
MRWAIGLVFSFIGVLLLTKGLSLRAIGAESIDGDGIGVYFLGMEISDRVPTADIPTYANSFLGTGVILLLLAVSLFVILLKEKNTFKPIGRKNHA